MPDTGRSPYVGPQPFRLEDAGVFFGREQEGLDLLSLVIAHQAVLLYAQSGAGKTSLLNASLVPRLMARGTRVLFGMRVGGDLPKGIGLDSLHNVYMFNALSSIGVDGSDESWVLDVTLGQFLGSTRATEGDGARSLRVVIFDQLEEIFTSYSERWRDRADFFDQIGDALEADTGLRVVLAMREEHIASMDPFANTLPDGLRCRFRLERLRAEAALEAVTKPLQGTGRSFASGAAETLVANLLLVPARSVTGTREVSGEFVEPVQLQVVCEELWNRLPADVMVIDTGFIADHGDVDEALARYYETCLKRAVQAGGVDEKALRRWFEKHLITVDRTRGTVYKEGKTSGGLASDVVKRLEDLHLVRVEVRGGAPWYELTHDRFINPIIRSNAAWRASVTKRWSRVLGAYWIASFLLVVLFLLNAWNGLCPTCQLRISPPVVTLIKSQPQVFRANSAVKWSSGVLSNGLYVPPSSFSRNQRVTITAMSTSDPKRTASAEIFLATDVGVSVRPQDAEVESSCKEGNSSCRVALVASPTFAEGSQQHTSVIEWFQPPIGRILVEHGKSIFSADKVKVDRPTTVLLLARVQSPIPKIAGAWITVLPPRPWFLPRASHSEDCASSTIGILTLIAMMGALGGIIQSCSSFWPFVGNRDMKASWLWWYFLKPLIGASLALIVYLVFRGGFGRSDLWLGSADCVKVAALAGLIGFFGDGAILKLRETFQVLFSVKEK